MRVDKKWFILNPKQLIKMLKLMTFKPLKSKEKKKKYFIFIQFVFIWFVLLRIVDTRRIDIYDVIMNSVGL